MQQADVVVIGSGQGGVPLAKSFAEEGRKVILFERAQFGGTCVNYGCLPSKAFLASAHAAQAARSANRLGIHAWVDVDFRSVMERARATIRRSENGVEKGLTEAGVQLVEAEASFVDDRTVRAETADDVVEVQAELIVINTGASPAAPPIEGLEDVDYLTYQSFWGLTARPERTLLVGGGYVGVELGQGLARLGSKVSMVERSERIVDDEEADVSETLTRALKRDGVYLYTGAEVVRVRRRGETVSAVLKDGQRLEVDCLLIATGRKPNTEALNTDAAGIELNEKGHVRVDAHFRTSNPNVYAIGDVTGQPAFTHVSWEDYRRLRAILRDEEGGEERRQQDRVLGYVFFTEPQVGRVGLTLEEARARGLQAEAVTMPLTDIARAGLTSNDLGFYRMVIDTESEKILGATLVGPQCGELAHVFMAHMEAGSTWHVLERSVHVHPTFAEGLPVLARKFTNRDG